MRAWKRSFIVAVLFVSLLPLAAHAQSGGLRYTITVAEFENRSNWEGQEHLGHDWKQKMTGLLAESGHFIVVADTEMRGNALDEQDLNASGLTAQGRRSPVSGQMTPAQLLLQGAITHVQLDSGKKGGGVRIGGAVWNRKKQEAEVGATISLVDSTTGQVVASTNITGLSTSRRRSVSIDAGDAGVNFSGEKNENLDKALQDAAAQSIKWLVDQLPSLPWSGTVVTILDGKIVVDRGAQEGVQQGQIFRVGKTEVLRSPDTGEILDEWLDPVAEIEVTQVRPRVSYCRVVSGDPAAVRKGLSIQLP